MKSLYSLLALLLLGGGCLHAEQLFVLFDGSCGERVRYEQAVSGQPRMDFYTYNFTMPGGSKLILETGTEGNVTQNYLPQGYLYCNDPRLSLALAERVNGNTDRVFILLPVAQNQYLVQPVTMAATLQRNGNDQFTYASPLTAFQFDTKNGIVGVNLSLDRSGNKVYFEGRDNNTCNGVYLFRQLSTGSAYPVIDYKLVPELGLMERRLGSDGRTTSGGVITVQDVNGQAVPQYLASICASATALASRGSVPPATVQSAPGSPQTYNATAGLGQPQPYNPPTGGYPVTTAQPESQAARPMTITTLTHTVAKGETLYGISRQYNTTVDAIKATNGMSGNTVFVGQQLAVNTATTTPMAPTAPVAVTGSAPPATQVPRMPYNPGNVAASNPGAAYPTPYGGTTAAPTAYGQPTTMSSPVGRGGEAVYGDDIHIVQPGETVASVALKYGYTSAKFREMNDLGPNDIVRVGERLKTSDCNCPAAAPAATSATLSAPAAPTGYGTAPATPQPYQPAATPGYPVPNYGAPATTAPAVAPSTQPTGTPVGTTNPSYRAPTNYTAPAASPATAPAPARTTISNDPNFGQVVPNASAAPSTTLSNLESRSPTPAPATYGSFPAVRSPQPAAAPQPYGGTPVGVGADYSQPTNAQPTATRSFHLVQEGESLFSISQRYGMSVEQLRALNQLAPTEVIVPFQKLYLN